MTDNYDRIARFYDVDMARNMALDDVGFYARVCAERGGRVLELGCGNGRVLLALAARGVDTVGVDASAGMLAELLRKARAAGLVVPVCRMDVRALAFGAAFDVVLCPYSLITYLTTDADLARLLAEVRRVLRPGGAFVVDAFVPRPAAVGADFRLDYRRPCGEFTLARWKRITPLDAQRNRIERRYELLAADGSLAERVDVAEVIRPFAPGELRALLTGAGFAIDGVWWDYGRAAADGEADAQFCTVVARPLAAPSR